MGDGGDERIAATSVRLLQRRTVPVDQWTQARRQRFLDALADSCDVAAAARAAGMPGKSIYHLRRADPVFAGLWREALAIGYERLEAALLSHALAGVDAREMGGGADKGDAAGAPQTMTSEQVRIAIAILNRHDASQGRARDLPRGLRTVSLADAEAALTKRLDMIAGCRAAMESDPA